MAEINVIGPDSLRQPARDATTFALRSGGGQSGRPPTPGRNGHLGWLAQFALPPAWHKSGRRFLVCKLLFETRFQPLGEMPCRSEDMERPSPGERRRGRRRVCGTGRDTGVGAAFRHRLRESRGNLPQKASPSGTNPFQHPVSGRYGRKSIFEVIRPAGRQGEIIFAPKLE